MVFTPSIRYVGAKLAIDALNVEAIVQEVGTPTYIYSLSQAVRNYESLKSAYAGLDIHIHYSAKANGNLAILKTLADAGAGVDTVSMGEIYKAIHAGFKPEDIVFAGVGKTSHEIRYALEQGIGWFNVENVLELDHIQSIASELGIESVHIALRLNPQVTANTHPYISTGHGGAKFGLTAEVIASVLTKQSDYPNLNFAGIHLHIGSQLGDTEATLEAVQKALKIIDPYEMIQYINLGGGLPAAYRFGEEIPSIEAFAQSLVPMLKEYKIMLEPGRSIIANAGILVTEVLYVKKQAGQTFYITDSSMTELIRPSLYQAHHEIVPIEQSGGEITTAHIVGPVCESTDVMAKDRELRELHVGDKVAVMTAGAYGMVMASNYNARLRPAEVVVHLDGETWSVARQRETLDDLLRHELDLLK